MRRALALVVLISAGVVMAQAEALPSTGGAGCTTNCTFTNVTLGGQLDAGSVVTNQLDAGLIRTQQEELPTGGKLYLDGPTDTKYIWQTSNVFQVAGVSNVQVPALSLDQGGISAAQGYGINALSRISDGATAVGHIFDTNATLATSGAKLASWRNNTVEKAYVDKAGNGAFAGVSLGGSAVRTSFDFPWTINDPVTLTTNTSDFVAWTSTNASTVQNCNCLVPIAGGGTGNETWKLTDTANGAGTAYLTVVIPCNAAVGAHCTSCTINIAAVPAATTLHGAITTACTTADVASSVTLDISQP